MGPSRETVQFTSSRWVGLTNLLYGKLSKPFDRVPHYRLLLKQQTHDVDGKVLNWSKAGVGSRVQIKDKSSEWGSVVSGVPQGQCWVHCFLSITSMTWKQELVVMSISLQMIPRLAG